MRQENAHQARITREPLHPVIGKGRIRADVSRCRAAHGKGRRHSATLEDAYHDLLVASLLVAK
ncbi:MAG: hypothetical protein ACLQUY_08280 [Ktedonobacterales bacterium]